MFAIAFTTSFIGANYVLFTYVAPLLSETMGFGRDGITAILVIAGVGAVFGNIMGGILADRVGWHRTLTGLCVAQMLLTPGFSLLPFGTAVLVMLVFAWSLASWSFMAGQQLRLISLAGHRAPVMLPRSMSARRSVRVSAGW